MGHGYREGDEHALWSVGMSPTAEEMVLALPRDELGVLEQFPCEDVWLLYSKRWPSDTVL